MGSALAGGGAADVGSCADESAAEVRIMKVASALPRRSLRRFRSDALYKITITSRHTCDCGWCTVKTRPRRSSVSGFLTNLHPVLHGVCDHALDDRSFSAKSHSNHPASDCCLPAARVEIRSTWHVSSITSLKNENSRQAGFRFFEVSTEF